MPRMATWVRGVSRGLGVRISDELEENGNSPTSLPIPASLQGADQVSGSTWRVFVGARAGRRANIGKKKGEGGSEHRHHKARSIHLPPG